MDLKTRLTHKLDEIAKFLLHHNSDNTEIGVLGGISGIALFYFYYAKYKDDDTYADKGADTILETFDRIENGYSRPTFCDGIAGACWTLELLKEEGFIELQEDIITPELDTYLFEIMKKDIVENNYDFLHGAIGYGYYFLKRYQNVTSDALKKRYKQYLDVLVSFIRDTAIHSDAGIWWKSEIRVGEEKFLGCNLGLSHGISSILNFLSRLVVFPDFYGQVQPILKPSTRYILSCKHSNPDYSSSFPRWITTENPKGFNSRLAWCYGDLGVGISLLRVGEVLNDQELYKEALNILKRSTKRRDVHEASIKDVGVCHGAFGVMHIYNYLFKGTGDILFKETGDYWATIALDMSMYKKGSTGYIKEDRWKAETILLDGIAGIGLTILACFANFDPKWDEALLIGGNYTIEFPHF